MSKKLKIWLIIAASLVALGILMMLGVMSVMKWNFTKFVVDKDGKVVDRFGPTDTPEQMEDKIKELL